LEASVDKEGAQAGGQPAVELPFRVRPNRSRDHPAIGSPKRNGFTLIEMLVVLLVMGLFVGLVSTIVQPDDRALVRIEAERLAQLLELAATKSRYSGKSIAWTADRAGYRFWQLSDDAFWSEIRDDDALRPRELPKGMTISGLQVENMRSPENTRLEFSPYGATLSFTIELSLGSATDTVSGSPIGEVRVLTRNG
jgi:general secretion pathway protein H